MRCQSAALVAAAAVVLASAAPAAAVDRAAPREVTTGKTLAGRVLAEVNAVRARHRLAPLRGSRVLAAAASGHSRSMAQHGFFAHESVNGAPFWKRLQRVYAPKRSRNWSVGENLFWADHEVSAAEVVRQWLASPPHRANLLRPTWREIGISVVHAAGARGVFEGLDVTLVTADFGFRHAR